MTVVPVHPLDATWLAALHRACFPHDPWDSAAWETLLRQPGVVGWALVDEEVPVGFVLARHVADEAEILTIGIVPGHRRSGGGACCSAMRPQTCRRRSIRCSRGRGRQSGGGRSLCRRRVPARRPPARLLPAAGRRRGCLAVKSRSR
jgi:hypothetical protein